MHTCKERSVLLLTGGDIKHIFLLQFYAIESRKDPIFRYQSHTQKKKMKHLKTFMNPDEEKNVEIEKDHEQEGNGS